MPALLTRMSIPPSASAAALTAGRTSPSSVTSAWNADSRRAVAGDGCQVQDRDPGAAPGQQRRGGQADPEAPPVTTAVRPSNSAAPGAG